MSKESLSYLSGLLKDPTQATPQQAVVLAKIRNETAKQLGLSQRLRELKQATEDAQGELKGIVGGLNALGDVLYELRPPEAPTLEGAVESIENGQAPADPPTGPSA